MKKRLGKGPPGKKLPGGKTFLDGRVTLLAGDCLDVLKTLPENSIDSCVTDPPYHLTSIVQRFGSEKAALVKTYKTGAYGGGFDAKGTGTGAAFARMSRGFMGKQWDGGDIAFRPDVWREVFRVLKPGAHLLSFGGTRTYHRMACAIEDAGFEIRDCVQWLYGSGFPKSHDVSKGIDKTAGHWRGRAGAVTITYYAAAREWSGWGTALKPACEMIVLARKPLSEKTVAANVLKWGTGAINIDGCRVDAAFDYHELDVTQGGDHFSIGSNFKTRGNKFTPSSGRWPANCILDGSDEVVGAFPESESTRSVVTSKPGSVYGMGAGLPSHTGEYGFNDSDSAARFFYTAKADADDRLGSKHPTVKPLDLIQYLVRLVTPPRGVVLDPFAGTGTAGEAAWREGMRAVLIEREKEYVGYIERRMSLAKNDPIERKRVSKNPTSKPQETLF